MKIKIGKDYRTRKPTVGRYPTVAYRVISFDPDAAHSNLTLRAIHRDGTIGPSMTAGTEWFTKRVFL